VRRPETVGTSTSLQIKLLKFLQFYPGVVQDAGKRYVQTLWAMTSKILTETNVYDSVSKRNTVRGGQPNCDLWRQWAHEAAGLSHVPPWRIYFHYLSLMTMARLTQLEGSAEFVKKHQATVLVSLKEAPQGTLFVTVASKHAHKTAVKVSRSRKSPPENFLKFNAIYREGIGKGLLTQDTKEKTKVRNDAIRWRRDALRVYRPPSVQRALRMCQIRLVDDRLRACGTWTWHGG